VVSGYQNYNTEIQAAAVISWRVCFAQNCLARLAPSRHQSITVRLHLINFPSTALPFFLSALRPTSSASRKKAIGIIGADYELGYGHFPLAISKISRRVCWNFFQCGQVTCEFKHLHITLQRQSPELFVKRVYKRAELDT